MSTRGGYYTNSINKQKVHMKGVYYINSTHSKGNKVYNSNSSSHQRRTNTSTSHMHTRNESHEKRCTNYTAKREISSYGRCSNSCNGKMNLSHTTRANTNCYLNLYTTRGSTRNASDTPRAIEKCKSHRQVTPQYASKWHLNKQLTRSSRTTQQIKQSRSYCGNNNNNSSKSGKGSKSYCDKYRLNTYRNYNITTYAYNHSNGVANDSKRCRGEVVNGKEGSSRDSNLNTTLSKRGEGFTVEGYKGPIDTSEELHFFYVYVIQNGKQ